MARKVTVKKTATKRKAPAKHRKGPLAVIIPWLQRFGRGLAVLAVIIWLGAWIIITGTAQRAADWTYHQFLTKTAQAGLRINNLLVEGRIHTDPALLTALLNIETGDPILGINPHKAKALLKDTKWIESAFIQRRLPDTLYIKLTERTPMALFKSANGALHVIDTRGHIIDGEGAQSFPNLITVSGDNADTAAPALIELLLQTPDLFNKVTAAQRHGNRRWDIFVREGAHTITLKMPENENLPLAISRILKAQQSDNIFANTAIESIDLRFDDKMVIRTKPGQVIDYKQSVRNNEQGT